MLSDELLLCAGEPSGDRLGASLAAALRLVSPATRLSGLGGPFMEAAGVEIVARTEQLGVVGVTEALPAIPGLWRARRQLARHLRTHQVAAALLIGNDVFHVLLGRWLRRRGIPTVCWFPPQVWLWRALARWFAPAFDLILTSFPEEQEVYALTGTPTHFVGHYLCAALSLRSSRERALARQELVAVDEAPLIALLPGSRPQEIRELASLFLAAAKGLLSEFPAARFVVPLAEPEHELRLRPLAADYGLSERLTFSHNSRSALRAADFAIVASGTASLEAALLGVPMVIAYRVSRLTWGVVELAAWVGLIRARHIGLPNLILGREVVPELRPGSVRLDELVQLAAARLRDAGEEERARSRAVELRALLEPPGQGDGDAVERAARLFLGIGCGAERIRIGEAAAIR